jgi:protein-tyrosine phosphatase
VSPELSSAGSDRAAGALLGAAAGEALRTPDGTWQDLTAAALTTARVGDLDRGRTGSAVLSAAIPLALAGRAGEIRPAEFADADAGEACAVWSAAVQHAVRTGIMDPRIGLAALEPDRAQLWATRLAQAESCPAGALGGPGSGVVQVLQAAWSAVHHTPVPEEHPRAGSFRVQHLRAATEAAAATGSAAVAAAAGALLGAAYGASAVPSAWRRSLHDGAGARVPELTAVAAAATGNPLTDPDYSMSGDKRNLARHPYDEQLWFGGYNCVRKPPEGVDTLVSLTPVAQADIPADTEWIQVRLADSMIEADNPNLPFVLHDTADLIVTLRAEGRMVLVHAVQGKNRAPSVACAYSYRRYELPVGAALLDIRQALLGGIYVYDVFRVALAALAPVEETPPIQPPVLNRWDVLTDPKSKRAGRRGTGDWPEGRTTR